MGNREYTEEQSLVGLTENEVQERIAAGQMNRADITTEKTAKQIILSNTLTYFNLIFLVSESDVSACGDRQHGDRHRAGAAGKKNTG